MGRSRLVAPGQVHPELGHGNHAAALGRRPRVELLMHQARARRHPLDVAGADAADGAGGIAMLHLAVIDDGDGLETLVGMGPHARRLVRGAEHGGGGVIEHQEGADLPLEREIGEERAHQKAIAHPVGLGRVDDARDGFQLRGHGVNLGEGNGPSCPRR